MKVRSIVALLSAFLGVSLSAPAFAGNECNDATVIDAIVHSPVVIEKLNGLKITGVQHYTSPYLDKYMLFAEECVLEIKARCVLLPDHPDTSSAQVVIESVSDLICVPGGVSIGN